MTMRPYSNDLRERIVAAVDRGEHSLRQLAGLFAVSLSCIVRLLQRRRASGSVAPKPHGGGTPPKIDAPALERLRELLRDQPDATLAELRDRLGIPCSIMAIDRALRRAGITRKKKTLRADRQDDPDVQAQRKEFTQRLSEVEPEHLVFVDEMGATTGMTRTHGRSPAGTRVYASAPGSWHNVTLIAALRPSEVGATLALEGATDQQAFRTYVHEVLVPTIQPGDVVVWDHLSVHEDAEVIAALEAAGARVEPLPPYSPDLSPIEEMFSKIKELLRTLAARTVIAVMEGLGIALKLITPSDIQGWFQDRAAYANQT
jgi:transposase